ncbi:integrase arm-type DNA-binding domain-containing protein [Novosphingobium sp. AAP93]|uniref:tyrosine-type recombinase/integrase n=1 Tax=Novosphingobium sp. AAP93 TaxID=1523427 RepID=UPI0006B9DA62|nr:integrase arm-type DNA-binding domain-containing protein [Novosphingobium sp. AAP93]KPF80499.1 integrase [Novosphingobium sp. AAP93]
MALSITTIRNAKPKAKPYKLADEKGLFLLVQPSGGMLWRMKYRVDGRDSDGNPKRVEKKLGLGTYPEVSLKDARERRDEARRQLANGIDPAEQKRRDVLASRVSAANTFASVAEAYVAKNERDGLAANTIVKRRWFIRLLQKSLGHRPITEIQPFDVLAAVRPFEAAKNDEKAHRTLQFIGGVFRFAIANQLATSDPTRDLRGALAKRKPKHHAAILEPRRVGELLRAIDEYEGQGLPTTRTALQLLPYVFVRPGELQRAEWAEIDLDAAVWRIPAARMKGRQEHVVPLSRQAVALFKYMQAITGDGRYVFPSIRTPLKPISENTMNAALRRLGFTKDEMTAHGFRAVASTLLNESGKWSPDAIERALAHKDKDSIRAAYHRGAHWQERVEMAQWWADYLDALRSGAEVLQFPQTKKRGRSTRG